MGVVLDSIYQEQLLLEEDLVLEETIMIRVLVEILIFVLSRPTEMGVDLALTYQEQVILKVVQVVGVLNQEWFQRIHKWGQAKGMIVKKAGVI